MCLIKQCLKWVIPHAICTIPQYHARSFVSHRSRAFFHRFGGFSCGFPPEQIGETYPAWWTYKKLLKMAIEIVDLPIEHGDFP